MVYFASNVRSAYRKLETEIKLLEELDTKKFLNNQQKEEHILKVKKAQQDAEIARKDLKKYESATSDNDINEKIFRNISASKKQITTSSPPAKEVSAKIEETVRKGNFEFDDLSKLTNAEKKFVSKVFSVIADNLPDKKIIPSLVIKVKEAFK